jgi:hypothetical protein
VQYLDIGTVVGDQDELEVVNRVGGGNCSYGLKLELQNKNLARDGTSSWREF